MPFALPFVEIGLKVLEIVGLGAVLAGILSWVLPKVSGRLTWDNVINYIDVNVKQPVEWALKGIKARLAEAGKAFYDFVRTLYQVVEAINGQLTKSWAYIKGWINSAFIWRIQQLEAWRKTVTNYIYGWVTGELKTLRHWVTGIATDVYGQIANRLAKLESWRVTLLNYVQQIEADIRKSLESAKQAVLSTVFSITASLTDVIVPGISDYLKSFARSIANAVGIGAVISAILSLFHSIDLSLSRDIAPDMDWLDNLDIDWLLIAYVAFTRSVLIEEADEVLSILSDCFHSVAKG